MIPTNPARRLALLSVSLLLVVACGTTTVSPSPSPTPTETPATPSPVTTPSAAPSAAGSPDASAGSADPNAALYDAIEGQVVAIRGLEPVDVARETIDGPTLKEMNATSFDKDNPAELIAGNDRLLKALGLIPEDQDLRQLFLDLIDSQVAGFYRPDAKTLYVVSRTGKVTGADKITFAHEYDHALQDANFPGVFDAQKDLLDETDEAMARAAVYEGDATLLMTQWAIPNMTPTDLQEYLAAGTDPASNAVLARTPQILVDGLLFPYTAGLTFLTPTQATDGWAGIDAVFKDLPRSTEQVMHPEKYAAREEPIDVTIDEAALLAALGDGWSQTIQDTFGEAQTGFWLRQAGLSASDANSAAAGWGGDRLAVLDGPDDTWAVVMRTAWDSAADAADFEAAATEALKTASGTAGVFPGEGGTTRWIVIGSDAATQGAVAGALGLAG